MLQQSVKQYIISQDQNWQDVGEQVGWIDDAHISKAQKSGKCCPTTLQWGGSDVD